MQKFNLLSKLLLFPAAQNLNILPQATKEGEWEVSLRMETTRILVFSDEK